MGGSKAEHAKRATGRGTGFGLVLRPDALRHGPAGGTRFQRPTLRPSWSW
jgi:hypothetical protein